MYTTLLFDLDGTLLPMDMQRFLDAYLRLLARRVSRYIEPERFVKELLASTGAMVGNNDPTKTNEEVFMEDFFGRTGLLANDLRPVFDDFYATDFPVLIQETQPNPVAIRILALAQDKGYQTVVATNPIFPASAIRERLRWIGAAEFPFGLVTTYENMHFCKPNPRYYREITEMLGVPASSCLMVGNDFEEDLVASEVGMKTFLVSDWAIKRETTRYRPDYQGSLDDLLRFVQGLPGIS